MIKQSKTTIKELTAQYRAVLKHAFFAGIAAVAVVSTANAAVTPDYIATIAESIGVDFVEQPDISTYLYDADGDGTVDTAIDGSTTAVDDTAFTFHFAGDEEGVNNGHAGLTVAGTDSRYTFTAQDSATTSYNANSANIDATKYKWTAASGEKSLTAADVAATELAKTGYTYSNWNEETKQISDGEPNPANYTFTNKSGVEDSLGNYISGDEIALPTSELPFAAEAIAHFDSDKNAYDAAYGTWDTDQTAYLAATEKLDADIEKLANMKTNFSTDSESLAGAKDLRNTAQTSLTAVNGAYNTAKNAADTYDASLGKAIDAHVLNEDGAVAKAVTNLIDTKEDLLSADIGYDLGNPDDAEKGLVARLDALTADSDDKTLVGAINANTDAITNRTVSMSEDGSIATIADGTNTANVYTKEAAEAIFAEKQQWVDNTLGITSENTDAVKNALTGTIAGEESTMTGAINALDTAIAGETTRAKGVEEDLDTRLGTVEADYLKSADKTELSGLISSEATRAMEEEAAIRSEFAAADELTLSSAKAFANAGDELTLSKANAYTDAKVDTLEKNVSGGIAAATALSAVEVSNVKRGEMSVGGGYGYYNGQSAGAFGMAMGLSDNWSVNAGAGIASGDKTQVSFRAGTNYKFKLF